MDVFDLPGRIAGDFTVNVEFAVHQASFGDGYSQRSPAGLNSRRETAEVTWPFPSPAEAEAIRAFLDRQRGAGPFRMALPCGQPPRTWIVRKYSYRTSHPHTITATLEEVFDP